MCLVSLAVFFLTNLLAVREIVRMQATGKIISIKN
jgi:hypothetical protein